VPPLNKAKSRAGSTTCMNNGRQIALAFLMYPDDNAGWLTTAWNWCPGSLNYQRDWPDNTNVNLLVSGLLAPYAKNVKVYKCPADASYAWFGSERLPRVRSISMSQAFRQHASEHWDAPPWRIYKKVNDMILPPPVGLWVTIDENPDSVNDAAFATAMDGAWPSTRWQDGPSVYHCGGCGFTFADGHSLVKKWVDGRTRAIKTTYQYTFPYNLFQASNPDTQWVNDRTTMKLSATAWIGN